MPDIEHSDGKKKRAPGGFLRAATVKKADLAAAVVPKPETGSAEDPFFKDYNFLRTLMDSLPDYIYVKDAQSRFVFSNNAHLKALGAKDLFEVVGKTDFDFFPLELAQQYYDNEQMVMASGQPLLDKIEYSIDPAGRKVWLMTFKAPLRDSTGQVVGLIGASRDISELRRAETALRASEERFRQIFENSRDVAFKLNLDTSSYEYISPSVLHVSGFHPEEIIALGPEAVLRGVHPEDRERVRAHRENLIAGISAGGASPTVEYRLRYRSGQYRWVSKSSTVLRDPETEGLSEVGTIRDITERKKAEEALLSASRMEATATLAGGIAHTFNNLMVGVLGNAELLQMHFSEDPKAIRMLSTIAKSARQAGELAQHMLAFSLGGKYQPTLLNLNDTIHETLHLEERSFPSNIEVEQSLDSDLWNVMADPVQMAQILINLTHNAVEALEGGGCVRVTTTNTLIDEDFARRHDGLEPGRYICLTVEDNGRGMSPENAAKVFEPFFTTKVQGRGLGLAAVYGIVKNHGGHVAVTSEEGKGACFRVYLAATSASQPQSLKASQPLLPVRATGNETVLLVDDEEMVIGVTQQVLKRLGYRVIAARNGLEAIEIARSYDGAIDIAVLDLGMPGMGGAEAFPLLKEARPDLKVIITSGYELDETARRVLEAGASAFVQKPFPASVLSARIHEALGN